MILWTTLQEEVSAQVPMPRISDHCKKYPSKEAFPRGPISTGFNNGTSLEKDYDGEGIILEITATGQRSNHQDYNNFPSHHYSLW